MLVLAAGKGMDVFAHAWLSSLLAPQTLQNPGLVEAMVDMIARRSVQELAAHTLAALHRRDYASVLGTIDVLALVLAGESDPLRPVSVHREMAKRIRGSRFAIIENSGHMLAMEQPEVVTQHMRQWLLE